MRLPSPAEPAGLPAERLGLPAGTFGPPAPPPEPNAADAAASKLSLPGRVPTSPGALAESLRSSFDAIRLPARLAAFDAPPVTAAPPPAPFRAPPADPAPGPDAEAEMPAGFRLEHDRTWRRSRQRQRQRFFQASLVLAAGLAGYLFGLWHTGPAAPSPAANRSKPLLPGPPNDADERALDAAYTEMRSGQPADARRQFAALAQQHSQWLFLNREVVLAAMYANDGENVEKIIVQSLSAGALPLAEGKFLLGLMALQSKQFEDGERYLSESAGADPTRADTYYLWGECLLRWGKPNRAVAKLRAALLRNPYPALDNLYQSKLWLAEIESGFETSDGTAQQIDQALAVGQPTSAALIAKSARAIKAGQFAEAADALVKAQRVSDPAAFRALLDDPYFSENNWRPEFTPIYIEAFRVPASPAASPPASPSRKEPEPAKQP